MREFVGQSPSGRQHTKELLKIYHCEYIGAQEVPMLHPRKAKISAIVGGILAILLSLLGLLLVGPLTAAAYWFFPIVSLAYIAGFVAFAVFYSQEKGTREAKISAIVGVILAILLSLPPMVIFGVAVMGAATIAATFYVAARKNRSRAWAIASILLGPIILLIVVSLPKLPDEGTLALTT